MERPVLDEELEQIELIIPRYGPGTCPLSQQKRPLYFDECLRDNIQTTQSRRQIWLAHRLAEVSRARRSRVIPFVFRARDPDGNWTKFMLERGCIPLLRDNNFGELIRDEREYVVSARLTDRFFEHYGFPDSNAGGGRTSATEASSIADETWDADEEQELARQLSRLADGILGSIASSGEPRSGINPERRLPPGCDAYQMLRRLWDEQNGICTLCGHRIPVRSSNRLLQLSPDRIDSTNIFYSPENTRLTHLACNLGKNDATIASGKNTLQ